MATFVRYSQTTPTSLTAVNGSGPTNASIIIGLIASNTGTASDTIDVTIGSDTNFIIKNAPVPTGSTLSILDGKLVLNASDVVKAKSTNGNVIVTLSVLEL
jgi:hypothetical protein